MRGSVSSRRDWLARAELQQGKGAGLDREAGLPRWPSHTEASQGGHRGFTTQEMGSARRTGGGGGEGLARPFSCPSTRACALASLCPVLSWEEALLWSQVTAKSQSRGCSQHLLLPRSSTLPLTVLLLGPSLTPHRPTRAVNSSPFTQLLPFLVPPQPMEPPGLPLPLEKAQTSGRLWPALQLRPHLWLLCELRFCFLAPLFCISYSLSQYVLPNSYISFQTVLKANPGELFPPPRESQLLLYPMYLPQAPYAAVHVWEVHAGDLGLFSGTVSAPGSGFSALATQLNVLGTLKNPIPGLGSSGSHR